MQTPEDFISAQFTRRSLFGQSAMGLGSAALASLFGQQSQGEGISGNGLPHHTPKAKNVIYLFQNGGPSHVDLFDYKPELSRLKGEQIPESIVGKARFSTMTSGQTARPCLPEISKFAQHGQSGATVSDFMANTAKIADDLCFIKSMHTTQVNHAPAITFFLTGSEMPGRPSMGSWLTYGLGVESQNLPGFVVMTSRDKEASCGQIFYDFYWSSGFLPSKYQGVKFRGGGDPVLYLENPPGVSRNARRAMLDDLSALNRDTFSHVGDPEIQTRIAQYEMSYQMQMSVPELTDLSNEPENVLAEYGPDVRRAGSFAYNCIMARRLVERGVRFIQLYSGGGHLEETWDAHASIEKNHGQHAAEVDQPIAALLADLENRGLLDETLVVWGGEFGRMPFSEGPGAPGRNHNPYGFSMWMAGGGVKGGVSHGATDEFGFEAVENKVHLHDLHATILHLMGLDHERLTYFHQGRNERLTDVFGSVVKEIVA